MKRTLILTLLLVCLCLLLAAGCSSPAQQTSPPKSPGDALLLQGEHEFQNNNLHAAEQLFILAQQNYTAAGNATAALHARYRATIAHLMTAEFPYNRSQIVSMIDSNFPGIPGRPEGLVAPLQPEPVHRKRR